MRPALSSPILFTTTLFICVSATAQDNAHETLAELAARVGQESDEAYYGSPFAQLSTNYFARFVRDSDAVPADDEVAVDNTWRIAIAPHADPLTELIAEYLAEFFADAMDIRLIVGKTPLDGVANLENVIALDDAAPIEHGRYLTLAGADAIYIQAASPDLLRDGVVHFAQRIGLRRAPFVMPGMRSFTPQPRVRLGTVPRGGSYRDLIFMGYNAVFAGGGNLHALSVSDAIPELAVRRQPGLLENNAKGAAEAHRHGLRTYAFLDTRKKFPKDDPVFAAHPDIRGALTWKADGEYVLCTEHPLVKQYLRESILGIMRNDPELDGFVVIIGGEGFYHCFMRPYGVEKGHTNCARCDALGAPTVVANLCNLLAESAREVNPEAEVLAWPYSAVHVWSQDEAQAPFIAKLKPGTGILTEIEKDEYVQKHDGVNKHLWDYSIDLIGPGERAKRQIQACKDAGISIYLKSEPELGFEAPRLPHIPCMDRWVDRAEALATCGADGAFVFPAFRPNYGTSAAEVAQFMWRDPAPDKEELLKTFAARIAGPDAAPYVRRAWKLVSDAIPFSPELPSYYTGPYYLGPAHPMCVDRDADLPNVFDGYYLFRAEITEDEGLKRYPTYVRSPTGNVPVFGKMYREMESLLHQAFEAMNEARPLVPERYRLMFDAEMSPIEWFYRTARTEANFYESCQLRDELTALAEKELRSQEELEAAHKSFARWRDILLDEQQNALAALPVIEADVRLDCKYGSDHTFSHTGDMIRAKLDILESEIAELLPALAARCGVLLD